MLFCSAHVHVRMPYPRSQKFWTAKRPVRAASLETVSLGILGHLCSRGWGWGSGWGRDGGKRIGDLYASIDALSSRHPPPPSPPIIRAIRHQMGLIDCHWTEMKHTRVVLEGSENRVPRRAEKEHDFDAGRPEGGSGPPTFLVLDMRWTGSCCRHYQPGIGHEVDRVMPRSLPAWYWT